MVPFAHCLSLTFLLTVNTPGRPQFAFYREPSDSFAERGALTISMQSSAYPFRLMH
jgi:hypothetical protein